MALNENSGRVEAVKLHVSNRTLQEPFRMTLSKSVAIVVFFHFFSFSFQFSPSIFLRS